MSDEEEQYEVDDILKHRKDVTGRVEFFVHWKGYPDSDNSWVNWDDMACKELIEEYYARDEAKKEAKKKMRKSKTPAKGGRSISPAQGTSTPTTTERKNKKAEKEPSSKKKKTRTTSPQLGPTPSKKLKADTPSSTTDTKRKEQQSTPNVSKSSKSKEKVSSSTVKENSTTAVETTPISGSSKETVEKEKPEKKTEQTPQQGSKKSKEKNPRTVEGTEKKQESAMPIRKPQETPKEVPSSTVQTEKEKPPSLPKLIPPPLPKKVDIAKRTSLPAKAELQSVQKTSKTLESEAQVTSTQESLAAPAERHGLNVQKGPREELPQPQTIQKDTALPAQPSGKQQEKTKEDGNEKTSAEAATAGLAQLKLVTTTAKADTTITESNAEATVTKAAVVTENANTTEEQTDVNISSSTDVAKGTGSDSEEDEPGLVIDESPAANAASPAAFAAPAAGPAAPATQQPDSTASTADDEVIMSESVRRRLAQKAKFAARTTETHVPPVVQAPPALHVPPIVRVNIPRPLRRRPSNIDDEGWEEHAFLLSSTSKDLPEPVAQEPVPVAQEPVVVAQEPVSRKARKAPQEINLDEIIYDENSKPYPGDESIFKASTYGDESDVEEKDDDDDLTDYEDLYGSKDEPTKIPLRQDTSINPYDRGLKAKKIIYFTRFRGRYYAGVVFHGWNTIENLEYSMIRRLDPVILANYYVKMHKRCLARGIDMNRPGGFMEMLSDEESDDDF